MTKFFKLMKAPMQDLEFNRRFTEAILADKNKEISKEDEETYKRMQAKYPTVEDFF